MAALDGETSEPTDGDATQEEQPPLDDLATRYRELLAESGQSAALQISRDV